MQAIQVEELTKRYGDVLAVDNITFTADTGGTIGLLGGNGAGKTTTIAMLLGLLVPSAGRITVLGHDMAKDRFAALARMNFSSPYVALPHRLTVKENLEVYGHLYNVPKMERRIGELADQLDLAPFLNRPAGQLSAGQKTRVALAKALINRPDVLLLDEPTASLDPDTADLVRSWLERYRAESGCTILLASHNMAEVERLCSHVLMLKQRQDRRSGQPRRPADALWAGRSGGRVPRYRPRPAPGRGGRGMIRRIWGLMYRHLTLYRRSWPRLLELCYWPVLHMCIWGFTASFLASRTGQLAAAWPARRCWAACCCGRLRCAARWGMSISFLEEMWSRNLGHVFVSPLRPFEMIAALIGMSIIRMLLGVLPAILLAWAFYAFNLFSLGPVLVLFFINLMIMGWAVALGVVSLILRHGSGAEPLAWGVLFGLAPFSAVFYPVSVLPWFIQPFSLALPSAHVFEGMRAALMHGEIRWDHLAAAFALNIVWIVAASLLFARQFHQARVSGALISIGE